MNDIALQVRRSVLVGIAVLGLASGALALDLGPAVEADSLSCCYRSSDCSGVEYCKAGTFCPAPPPENPVADRLCVADGDPGGIE
jgi:hypothetical protein